MSKKAPRRAERAYAFKVLYGLSFTPATSEAALLKAFLLSPDKPEGLDPENSYAWELVMGVWQEQERLDSVISGFSQNWRVERLGKVEVTILRIALYELTHERVDVPPKVAINEAVELSRQYSDEKARIFVNGVLDTAARTREAGKLSLS